MISLLTLLAQTNSKWRHVVFFTKLKECALSNFAFLAVLRCQMINDNRRWLSQAPKDCGVMERIVYLIDTYFFDHMHPLCAKMTTKNHFIIGTILKSITVSIYHSFSTYCSMNALLSVGLLKETRYTYILVPLLRKECKSNKSLVLGNECICHYLVVLMSDAIKRIVNTILRRNTLISLLSFLLH